MEERAVPIQKIAGVLNMSVDEVEELCKNNKIPFIVIDPGTAWEAKRFYAKEVLKAVKPKKEEAEKEPVKEEAEKEPVKEEANPLAEEKAKEEEKPAEEPEAEKESEKTSKKEPPKQTKTKTEDPL